MGLIPKTYFLSFDQPTPLLNIWQRLHYRARARLCEQWSWRILQQIKRKPRTPIQRCTIDVCRYSAKKADWDGFYGGLKPVLDCLVVSSKANPHGLGLIVDDNPDVVIELKGRQEVVAVHCGYSTMKITEVAEE